MGYRLKENPNGNVSKEVFVKKLKELNLMFPTWKMDLSNQETVKLLYKHLGYCNDRTFEKGIDEYISKETDNPTVARLKVRVKSYDGRKPNVINVVDYNKNLICERHSFGVSITLNIYPNGDKIVTFLKDDDFINLDLTEVDFIEETTQLIVK